MKENFIQKITHEHYHELKLNGMDKEQLNRRKLLFKQLKTEENNPTVIALINGFKVLDVQREKVKNLHP